MTSALAVLSLIPAALAVRSAILKPSAQRWSVVLIGIVAGFAAVGHFG